MEWIIQHSSLACLSLKNKGCFIKNVPEGGGLRREGWIPLNQRPIPCPLIE